ncbi:MAG: ATP-binding protein, partial [Bacteroidota bacterium]|nr:ATP-binding protein [Bacteroidota bacterium]
MAEETLDWSGHNASDNRKACNMNAGMSAELDPALEAGLRDVRMPTEPRETADSARREFLSFECYLLKLTEQNPRTHRIKSWLRQSQLPKEKTLVHLVDGPLSVLSERHQSRLLEGDFLDRHENVLAIGPPCTRKNRLLCALGRELIIQRRRNSCFGPTGDYGIAVARGFPRGPAQIRTCALTHPAPPSGRAPTHNV